MKLIEILEGIQGVLDGLDMIKSTTICTLEDVVTRISEKKNQYIHALIVYDQKKIKVGEWSQMVPVSIIYTEKLMTDDSNKLHAHSNTISASIEAIQLIRQYFTKNNCEGALPEDTFNEIWTDQFGDAVLGGVKQDFSFTGSLGGFCEIQQ